MTRSIKKDFTVAEVHQLTGLKPRMLDYLFRAGVLVPTSRPNPGRGRDRLYSFNDVVVGRALSTLLRCGISVSKLKAALEKLRSGPVVTLRGVPAAYLITNGTDIFFTDRRDVFVNVNKGDQLVFGFVIGMRRLWADVLKDYHALTKAEERRAG